MSLPEFAIVDVETTGLFPGGYDRVVEIAVVRVNSKGQPLGEYATLVNPQRDVGPTHIHGISASDVRHAPSMEEIAGDVLALLAGAALVGHNVAFDHRFLVAEYERLGVSLPDCVRICTMSLARRLAPDAPSRKLADLCAHWGISLVAAHSALNDAHATAKLFEKCLQVVCSDHVDPLDVVPHRGRPVPPEAWPSLPRSGKCCSRGAASRHSRTQRSYLRELVARLPEHGAPDPDLDAYLAVIDRALEDRIVEVHERDALMRLAAELGLSSAGAQLVHRQYLAQVIQAALADGIITEPEQEDLDDVRRLLGVSLAEYEAVLADVGERNRQTKTSIRPATSGDSLQGKSVCFTGTFQCRVNGERVTRARAIAVAEASGMRVARTVTKKLDFLVAADPRSASGKARKAHEYGIRVIAEPVFWTMMGVDPS